MCNVTTNPAPDFGPVQLVFVTALTGCVKLDRPIEFTDHVNPREFIDNDQILFKTIDFVPRNVFHGRFEISLTYHRENATRSNSKLRMVMYPSRETSVVRIKHTCVDINRRTTRLAQSSIFLVEKEAETDFVSLDCFRQEFQLEFCKIDFERSGWQYLSILRNEASDKPFYWYNVNRPSVEEEENAPTPRSRQEMEALEEELLMRDRRRMAAENKRKTQPTSRREQEGPSTSLD